MINFKINGIKVRIHPLFWIVAIAAALTGQFLELITLFTLVIIHELGHVFAALAVGWRVTSMELLPFGGVAKVDEWGTTKARDEILVALAGPFVNLVMIGVSALFRWLGIWDLAWTEFFVQGNLFIACFNLLPIWPLDGGKVLQAIISKFFPYYKTIYATVIWSVSSICLLISISWIFPFQWNLLVISIYLLIENRLAWKQAQYQFIRFLLCRSRLKAHPTPLPVTTFYLNKSDRLTEVVKLIKKEAYHCFQVVDETKNIVASFPEEAILSAFFEKNPQRTISELIPIG